MILEYERYNSITNSVEKHIRKNVYQYSRCFNAAKQCWMHVIHAFTKNTGRIARVEFEDNCMTTFILKNIGRVSYTDRADPDNRIHLIVATYQRSYDTHMFMNDKGTVVQECDLIIDDLMISTGDFAYET